MKYQIDHDLHIHSSLSTCSRDPLQTKECILEYAKKYGLKKICITDHYWDKQIEGASDWYAPQDFDHISKIKPLPQENDIQFMFGCETELRKDFTLGLPQSRFDDFDFIIIPTTHMHFNGFTVEGGENEEERAKLWVRRLDAILDMPLPFRKIGIAHLVCPLINKQSREAYLKTLSLIPDSDMEYLFAKAAKLGCGIEINKSDMNFSESEAETVLRPFYTAKKCGCKFYLGSDVHQHHGFEKVKPIFENAINRLGLQETDKFHF